MSQPPKKSIGQSDDVRRILANAELRRNFIRFGNSLVDVAALNLFSITARTHVPNQAPEGSPIGHFNSIASSSSSSSLSSVPNDNVATVSSSNGKDKMGEENPIHEGNHTDSSDTQWPNGTAEFEVPEDLP